LKETYFRSLFALFIVVVSVDTKSRFSFGCKVSSLVGLSDEGFWGSLGVVFGEEEGLLLGVSVGGSEPNKFCRFSLKKLEVLLSWFSYVVLVFVYTLSTVGFFNNKLSMYLITPKLNNKNNADQKITIESFLLHLYSRKGLNLKSK
jgi:hypothetical protein